MFYQIKKNNSVSSTMFMKLTIKVVAFFLGHPVYHNEMKSGIGDEMLYSMPQTHLS